MGNMTRDNSDMERSSGDSVKKGEAERNGLIENFVVSFALCRQQHFATLRCATVIMHDLV